MSAKENRFCYSLQPNSELRDKRPNTQIWTDLIRKEEHTTQTSTHLFKIRWIDDPFRKNRDFKVNHDIF
jgi:endo-beta-N-acetylglucosaminidase D